MDWQETKHALAELSGVSEEIVEYISVIDLLTMHVTGLSNKDIADNLGIDEEAVRDTLLEYFDTEGFNSQQSGYYFVFNLVQGNKDKFLEHFEGQEDIYERCKKVKEITEVLDEYYQ